jgi:hypothetical protein
MARVKDLDPLHHTPEQAHIFKEIAGPRGGVVRGPFAIWLRNPELADKANQLGNANGQSVSVRALAWMIAGHEKHHIQVIKERYLIQNP